MEEQIMANGEVWGGRDRLTREEKNLIIAMGVIIVKEGYAPKDTEVFRQIEALTRKLA